MFNSINITNHALNANLLRMEVLNENVAHVDTPGYKRKDVAFQNILEEQIATENGGSLEFTPEIYVENSGYSARLDGNNVDVDREMSEIAKTKIRYDVLVQRATAQLGRYKYILQNIK